MVVNCYICKRQHDKNSQISFHVFPKATNSRTAWEKACKLQQPVPKTARICSEHFTIDSFIPKRDDKIKLLKPSAIPTVFPWNQDDNSTINNIDQTCIQDNVTSTIEQNQDCAHEIASSLCIDQTCVQDNMTSTIEQNQDCTHEIASSSCIDQTCVQDNVTSTIKQNQDCAHEIASSSCELAISYNECNLPRTPSTNYTNTKYNLSLSRTPSKRYLEDTQMPNVPNKIWRPARIGDLTLEHFSTRKGTLMSLQLIEKKTNQQAKKIKILQDKNRRLLKKVSSLQDLILHLKQNKLISENADHRLTRQYRTT